jgi:hypothetical protein
VEVDHISLLASLGAVRDAGFDVALTRGGGHGRVWLAGCYLEITHREPARAGWDATAWYLRPRDLPACLAELRQGGATVLGPSPYRGRDGIWLDARIHAPAFGACLPALTRRADPPYGAWPPPPASPHPNGVRGLRGLRLATLQPERLLGLLSLLGADRDGADGVRFEDGARIVVERGASAGELVEVVLDRGAAAPLHLTFGA